MTIPSNSFRPTLAGASVPVGTLISACLIVVLAVGTATLGTRLAPSSGTPPRPMPKLEDLAMETARMGWAVTAHRIWHTQNEGHTWTNVTPPGLRLQDLPDALEVANTTWSFLGPRSAWVVSQNSPGAIQLSFTQDGGASWQRRQVHLHPGKAFSNGFRGQYLWQADFYNANDGWIVLAPWGENLSTQLWATTTAGRTWRLENQSALGGTISFASVDDGWMVAGNPASAYIAEFLLKGHPYDRVWPTVIVPTAAPAPEFVLEHSTNRGRTWTETPLPFIEGMEPYQSPSFSGPNGLLAMWGWAQMGTYVGILRTIDGGRSWTPVDVPNALDLSGIHPWALQTIRGHVAWCLASGRLWRWDEQTPGWTQQTSAGFLNHPNGLDFLSAKLGWIWTQSPGGTLRVYETTSGGTSWTSYQPTINPRPVIAEFSRTTVNPPAQGPA